MVNALTPLRETRVLCCVFAQKAFVFRDIELTLPATGKVLIDKVTGIANAGRVLALMGPSGVCVCACVYSMTVAIYPYACRTWSRW